MTENQSQQPTSSYAAHTPASTIHPQRQQRVAQALKRFSIAAYITGIWLLVLVVEMIIKYLVLENSEDAPGWFLYIGMAHGLFFMIYLVTTLDLGTKARWQPAKWLTTCLAGTIPFLSFYIEHLRRKEVIEAFQLSS